MAATDLIIDGGLVGLSLVLLIMLVVWPPERLRHSYRRPQLALFCVALALIFIMLGVSHAAALGVVHADPLLLAGLQFGLLLLALIAVFSALIIWPP